MTTDNVDAEYIEKPKRWDISFIRRFMIIIGPVSSLFDFATFFTMLFIFQNMIDPKLFPSAFQTAWFTESLCSQTLVVLIIRTRRVPFYKSKPSKYLALMLLAVISFAIIIPFTPVGAFFGFVPPPPAYYLALAGILGAYALLAETVKKLFYKRYANRIEQVRIPKRRAIYVNRTAKLVQSMVAVISLRSEEEIFIDSLFDDLNLTVTYPFDPDEAVRNLQYFVRTGLINIDWQRRTITREKGFREYVTKNVLTSEMWPTVAEDWKQASKTIQYKYGRVNAEYQDLLSKRLQPVENA
jgi:hypothetical protein